MANPGKPDDSSFQSMLSPYLSGGSRSKQGMIILLIVASLALYLAIEMRGLTNLRNMMMADIILKIILFPFLYMLYLAFKGEEPDKET